MCFKHSLTQVCIHYGVEHAIFTSDEENVRIFAAWFLMTFNDSIFSIASVDINKIMVVFYHLLVCPWISVENII
jgi:hypothetical protein